MFRRFVLSCVCFIAFPVLGQTFSMSMECQEAVRAGENIRNPEIYSACGFDDPKKAFGEWALWAEKEKAGQALYEICVRHIKEYSAKSYCQKAINLENGPALLQMANEMYTQKDYTNAANFYTRALASPLLTETEKGDIAQKMGLLYLNPESSYYNPQKGMPLIEKAIDRRGAEANNLMGVYALFGMQGVPQNAEESFKYLWRSALLGCPAAEENLGLWHLARQKKIDNTTLKKEMIQRMFSCIPPEYTAPKELEKSNCDCSKIAERERLAGLYPYRLTSISEDMKTAQLLDKSGQEISVTTGTLLNGETKVGEIRKKVVFLISGNKRMILNLAPVDDCPELCKQQKENSAILSKTIRPYHFSFTPKECSDILYYAERLVDTTLPFTGKEECKFSSDMDKTADLLMNL